MSFLISGDTHGDFDLAKLEPDKLGQRFGSALESVTHLIVVGDWGAIWNDNLERLGQEKALLDFYDAMPWPTLVVTGNHEGYDRLERLPWEGRFGGPVRRASEKAFVLQNGSLYEVAGRRLFVFGGGESLDRDRRVEGQSWWPQEIPTEQDLERGLTSLRSVGGQVDYVLTHTCPRPMADHMVPLAPDERRQRIWIAKGLDPTVTMLTRLERELTSYRGWYFGHYHGDLEWQRYHCLYHVPVMVE